MRLLKNIQSEYRQKTVRITAEIENRHDPIWSHVLAVDIAKKSPDGTISLSSIDPWQTSIEYREKTKDPGSYQILVRLNEKTIPISDWIEF